MFQVGQNVIIILISEIFPTSLRHFAYGIFFSLLYLLKSLSFISAIKAQDFFVIEGVLLFVSLLTL
jgi:hypothetical protein